MRVRHGLLALVMLVALVGVQSSPAKADGWHMASESYYHLAVDDGRIEAVVEAEIQSAGDELRALTLFALPGVSDVTVTRDGTRLSHQVNAAAEDSPATVDVTLDEPLRGSLRAELTMTYSVSAHDLAFTTVEPGYIDSVFVSQGTGSFVLIDAPQNVDTVVDPGCFLADDQPSSVSDKGYERWVCGEVAMAALFGNYDQVSGRCARMSNRCRQRTHESPMAAFAQSVTDAARSHQLSIDVELREGAIPLRLTYFGGSGDWAREQFEIATEALPLLEEVFGHPYPHEQVLLRESNFLAMTGAAGVAYTESGEMLLTHGGHHDEHTTVHELAHQWAGLNLDAPWLWEGLAEYATFRVAGAMGLPVHQKDWQSFEYDDPLATWQNGSAIVDPVYWYGKSGAFWQAFESAVGGPEAMTEVLSHMDDVPEALPLDGRWFLDVGERVSGADLDRLFLDWVWHPERSAPMLQERREAHDLVDELRQEAAQLGFEGLPTDLCADLDAWNFDSIPSRVADARELLRRYEDLLAGTAEAGLNPGDALHDAWAELDTSGLASLLSTHEQVVARIASAETNLSTAHEDNPAHDLYIQAREAYNSGDVEAARELASQAEETAFNARASVQMLEVAGREQERFDNNFVERIGLLWHDPETSLAEAHEAFDEGDHASALRRAQSAYESWNGAQGRGLQRLALLAGLMAVLVFGAWALLQRLDSSGDDDGNGPPRQGHRIERPSSTRPKKPTWRDYQAGE